MRCAGRCPDGWWSSCVSDPLSWYERERAALVSGVRQAAQAGLTELCWSLAFTAVTLFESRVYFDDWRETTISPCRPPGRHTHVRGQAAMLLLHRGRSISPQQRFDPARRDLDAAAQLFQDIGDDQGFALVTRHIAFLDRLSGRLDDATRRYDQVLAIFQETGDQVAAAHVLHNLAHVKLEPARAREAKALLADALRLARAAAQRDGSRRRCCIQLGEADLLAGELARAVEAVSNRRWPLSATLGDPIGEAHVLQAAGVARVRQGEFAQARTALQRALELAGIAGDRWAEARALIGLSELALASGDPGQAVVLGQQASGIFRDMGAPLDEVRALTLLSDAHAALGDSAAAAAALADAAALRATLADNTPMA